MLSFKNSDLKMIELYEKYLFELNQKLDIYFSEQKAFIKCKLGCSLCCKFCYYPYSKLEYDYLKLGINSLDKNTQEIIAAKALKILKDRRSFSKNNNVMSFYYDCPILINDTCGLYDYRGLLCRTFGLAYHDIDDNKQIKIPNCVKLGLNYSDLYDKATNNFSVELENKIKIYDLSYSSLIRDAGTKINFGDFRMLFEWIIMDIPDYENIIKNMALK